MAPLLDLWVKILNYPLLQLGSLAISLSSVISVAITMLVVFLSIKISGKILQTLLKKQSRLDPGSCHSIATIGSYLFGVFIFFGLSHALGFRLESLRFIAGGLGLGIGFGLQNIVREFSSGLILLFKRRIKVNDFIQFGGRQLFKNQTGTITKISLFDTTVEIKDGGTLIVPNSHLLEQPLLNWSYQQAPNRVKILLRIRPYTDLLVFTETVMTVANLEPSVFKNPPPKLVFKKILNNVCEFELHLWIDSIKNQDTVINSINFNLEYELSRQGIDLSFPHQDFALYQGRPPHIEHYLNERKKRTATKDLLRKISYFQHFNDLDIRKLIEVGYRQTIQPQDILFREGDEGDAFYILLRGQVEVWAETLEKRLAVLSEGACFGELALMLGIPRTATVRAIAPTTLFIINHKGFKRLLQTEPAIKHAIVQELEQHQQELADRQRELREKGLVAASEDDANPVVWMHNRLKNLFALEIL